MYVWPCIVLCLASVQAAVHNAAHKSSFLTGTEYVYAYDSSAVVMAGNVNLTVHGEISVQVVSEVEEDAELLLSFNGISLTWRTKTGKYVDDSAVGDLTNWFSAMRDHSGTVFEVYYPINEAAAVTAFKKTTAELFSLNNKGSTRKTEGPNLIVMEAPQETLGKTVNKVATFDEHGILVEVKVQEIVKQTSKPEDDQPKTDVLLAHPIHSNSKLTLISHLPVTLPAQRPPPSGLVADTLCVTEVKQVVSLSEVQPQILEKLSCAAGSQTCLRELVALLKMLSEEDVNILANQYLGSEFSQKKQSLVLIDALSQLGSSSIGSVLTQHVLRSPLHNDDLILRALFHLATAVKPNRETAEAVEELVFSKDASLPVRHKAMLTLGSVARRLRPSDPQLANEIVDTLHSILEQHTGTPSALGFTKSKRSITFDQHDPLFHSILIDSLGNAGAEESFPSLVHHMTGDVAMATLSVQHSAVRAVRGYTAEESASTLLETAETSPHPTTRRLAARAYQQHPRRTRDLSHILQPSSPRSRRQLDSPDEFVSEVTMPPVGWNTEYGEQNITTDIGRTITNNFEIESATLSSKYKFSLHDETTFQANLFLSNGEQHSEILRTEFCLEGETSYNVRILNDFTPNLTSDQFTRHTATVSRITRDFESAYNEITASDVNYSILGGTLHDALDSLENNFDQVGDLLDAFLGGSGEIESLFELKTQAEDIYAAINDSYVDTFVLAQSSEQDISDAIDAILPSQPQAVVASLNTPEGQPFTTHSFYLPYFPYAPQKALTNIFSIYRGTAEVVAALQSSVENFQNLTDPYGPNRGWLTPSLYLRGVKNDLDSLLKDLRQAIDTADKSPTQSYDGATLSELRTLEQAVISYLEPSLSTLEGVALDFLTEVEAMDAAFRGTKDAFDDFTMVYDTARAVVDTIFGQRFHPEFPRRLKSCDSIGGCGSYPSTSEGLFRSGIDLQVEEGSQLVSPLSGYIQLLDPATLVNASSYSYNATNTILLTPAESSFYGVHFIITNIGLPDSSITSESQFFLSGAVISTLIGSFIHLEAYKAIDGIEYSIDATQFLQPLLEPDVSVKFDCNDFVTYVGGVVVDRRSVTPLEPELEYIGSPLVEGIPGHEFPQPHDLVLKADESVMSADGVQFFQGSTFLMVGSIPVQFDFASFGQYQLNYSLTASLLSKTTEAKVTPYLHARAEGTMTVGTTTFALVEISGSLVETSLPMEMRQEFNSWPLVASSSMDVVLAPTTLNLTTQLIQLTGVGEFASQEVLESQTLWEYSIPPLNRDEFYYEGSLSDNSAPVFTPLPYATDQSYCFVKQLPWRQYSTPAFELEFDVYDEQSLLNIAYKVGSFEGGDNIIPDMKLGGKRVVVPHELLSQEIFVTVSATNLNGLHSFASCQLPAYDRSPPMARINPIRSLSSHPSQIEVLVALFDEFGLDDIQEIAIGSVPGENGDDVLPWMQFDTMQIYTPPPMAGNVLNLFSFSRSGKLPGGILETIPDTNDLETCATMCSDADSCLSFDHSLLESNCILHSNIEGPETSPGADYENNYYTPPLQASQSYSYYEKLGVGNSTTIVFSSLVFEHNTVYYINMRLTNQLGYTNLASSSGFVVDLTPPNPGKVRDVVSDGTIADGCSASVLIPGCLESSGEPNHRVIVDGPGSATVFNGPSPLLDAMFTATSNYIAANWDGFDDPESDIYAYTWCVGTTLGSCDVVSPRDPHAHLTSPQYWTNTGLASSQNLSDGSYFISVQAISNVEYGGPLVTTVQHSTPYIIDTSPPLLVGVEVDYYDSSANELTLSYNASDAESGLSSVSVALGRSELDTALLYWTDVGMAGQQVVMVTVDIPDGVPTWVKVRATNNAGLEAITIATNSPVVVDRSPPTTGYLNDGPTAGVDIDYQSDLTMLCISGSGFSDPESGISEIQWGIGTAPGMSNTRPLTPLTPSELTRRAACVTGLSLVSNATYYSTIVVSNGAVNTLNVTVTSDGVHTDTTPPLPGSVFDGSDPESDQDYSSSLTTVATTWNSFTDYESQISHYILTVFRQPYGSTETNPMYQERIEGGINQIILNHFSFSNGDYIFVQLEAFNGAGLKVSTNSTGYIIDLTPPQVTYIVDGSSPASDLEYQDDSEMLSVVWQVSDDQSGISQIEGAVFELREGRRIRVYPDPLFTDATTEVIPADSVSWDVTRLNLVSGAKYITAITFTNAANLRSQYETNGVIVDTTPPIVESVSVMSDTYVDVDSGDLVTIVADLNVIEARWLASDTETGILEYLVGVVDENSTLVFSNYISFGPATGGLIKNLSLVPESEYRVVVMAVNMAALMSEPAYSETFRVAPGDTAGVVTDGEDPDIDYTDELTAITAHFYGFSSQTCGGVSQYEWAVGVGEEGGGRETVLPFTDSGIVVIGTNGSGYAQVLLPALDSYDDQLLYITVRGITGCGGILESTSNGFIIDSSPPSLGIIGTGNQAIERAQSTGDLNEDDPITHEEYQAAPTFSSIWEAGDDDSGLAGDVLVRVGTYPGGEDTKDEIAVTENYIRGSIMSNEGLPSYVTVVAENRAGLVTTVVSSPVVRDTTPPLTGLLTCETNGYPEPTLLWSEPSNTGIISCEWTDIWDPESGVSFYTVTIGTSSTDQSVMSGTVLAGNSNSYTTPLLNFISTTTYYVTLYVTNGAGLETVVTSGAVHFDTTPPILEGLVGVLPNSIFAEYNMGSFATNDNLTDAAVICLLETDVVTIYFEEPQTNIVRYDLGLGYSPGNDDLLSYQSFHPRNDTTILYHTLTPVHFTTAERRAIYFNIKACNSANLCSVISSHPIFIQSEANTLPSWIYDGPSPTSDIDYQTSMTTISGYFHIGTNCPIHTAQWAVESVDGMITQGYIDVEISPVIGDTTDNTFYLSTDQVQLYDDETYRILLQAVDYNGNVHILRSNGTSVTVRSLVPGLVQDGPISGQDLNYQESTTMLYAHWSGFGDDTPEQQIAYYEVAAGSDREYTNTRSDIAPFTYVGLNTSHTFTGLGLVSQSVMYYVTVRAHAISGAYIDSTSNGITAGYGHTIVPGFISLQRFQADNTTISTYWSEFESDLPIRSYEWALGTTYFSNDELQALCDDTTSNYMDNFEVFGFTFVDLDTSATATGLNLEHNSTYYITVRAIDEATKCITTISYPGLLIDLSPPEPQSFISLGPEESLFNIQDASSYVVYILPWHELEISWERFVDSESGTAKYELAIFAQNECGNITILEDPPFLDFINLGEDTTISFESLNFVGGVPYVVQVRATNNVGLSSSMFSQPILLDSTKVVPGFVKDGLNWESDMVFQSDLSMLSGVFAHAKLPPILGEGPCPQTTFYNLSFLDPSWSIFEPGNIVGVDMNTISYDSAQVSVDPSEVTITAVRDRISGLDRIITGAYQTQAQIANGGRVSFDILAAAGTPDFQAQAITSVVFIDSGSDTDVLADFELDLSDTFEYPASPEFAAFGLQIHRGSVNSTGYITEPKVVMWAKMDDPLSSPSYVTAEIPHNLSEVHAYTLDFQFEQLDTTHTRKVDLYIDEILTASLQGVPGFSEDTRVVIHMFNRLGYVPIIENNFITPTIEAIFANVTLPVQVGHLCDFGLPFYSEESPVVEFKAGAGTTPGALDILDLKSVSSPCRPCLPGPCSDYACDPNCTTIDPYTIPVTFYNLSLVSGYLTNINQSDAQEQEFESTNQNAANTMSSLLSNYFQPAVYYITVQAITASGQLTYATSNGITIDITPPKLSSPIEHFDVSFPQMEATDFQGSDSTISARWKFNDLESGISEYLWAIGTYPFGQDIQDFESVGMATEATNPSLNGVLEHNTTYFVTVIAINGAGLTQNASSGGVTIISTELNGTAVEEFVEVESTGILLVAGENGTQLEFLLAEREDRARIRWEGVPEDVDEIFWYIGTDPQSDDIFPRTEVGFNDGTSATIETGVLYIDSTPFANLSEVIALAEGKEEDPADNAFYFEPGRVLYHSLELCNFVHRCVVVETNPSIVVRTQDYEVSSPNRGDVTVVARQEVPEELNLPVLDREHRVTVSTQGGLDQGATLFLGFLTDTDVTRNYRVGVPYISDPFLTMAQTSREIARRFTEVGGSSFYISFLGQDNLNGPLDINVTFDPTLNWEDGTPELAYWDIDEEVWREVSSTCSNTSTIDWVTYTISAQMCSTLLSEGTTRPNSLTRKRRQIDNTTQTSSGLGSGPDEPTDLEFLDRPTQFIVIRIGNFSTNTPPELELPSDPLQVVEDGGEFTFQLFFSDTEEDTVDFHLTSLPRLGNASISLDGLLSYTPCPNCIGVDTLNIYIIERPFGINNAPLSVTGQLLIEVSNTNDIPEIFFYYPASTNGYDIIANRTVFTYIDGNRTEPTVIARITAYDYDSYHDDLQISVQQGDFGMANYQIWLDAVNTPESLPVNWPSESDIASYPSYITFVGTDITYLPSSADFIGTDEVSVLVRDSTGVFSEIITVMIEVLPSLCQNNGVCDGSDTDLNCTDIDARRSGFDGYNCSCLPEFGGQYCEIELSAPEALPTRACPNGIPIVGCDGDPCRGAVCPSHPLAECRSNYCGACTAEWYEEETLVQCSADSPDVCHNPVDIAAIAPCASISCECPAQPYTCPEDSVLVETRHSDCCVTYECTCPDISCPLLMERDQGVQPVPNYRGNSFPGRCCPEYSYEDINECGERSENLCSDICVNEDLTYSCTCPPERTLAQDGVNCGVCPYNGVEYLLGDRVKIGCNWCICRGDNLSGERWHCTAQTCDRGCIYNGLFYPVENNVIDGVITCYCGSTDTSAEWTCSLF